MNIYLAEFIGTAILILFGNSVVANVTLNKSKGKDSGWIVITAGWCFAVMVAIYSVGWISGAHLNPAITIGFTVAGLFPTSKVLGYIVAQILGAMLGQLLVFIAYKEHYDETIESQTVLASFSTSPAIRSFKWNFAIEFIATFMFTFGILAIGHSNNQTLHMILPSGENITGFTGILGPLLVGFYIWGIGLSLGGPTGYAINPARDLGPRIMHTILPLKNKGSSDWGYSWIPIVAPVVGAIAGAISYTNLF